MNPRSAALVGVALGGPVDPALVDPLSRDAGITPPALPDARAIDVARRCIDAAMSFDDADAVMNAAFAPRDEPRPPCAGEPARLTGSTAPTPCRAA